jgi:hypothetical protein
MTTVSTTRVRQTGTLVSVVDNRDGSFDASDLPWFTVCETHGGVCSHPTRRLAHSFAVTPEEWCPGCAGKGKRE